MAELFRLSITYDRASKCWEMANGAWFRYDEHVRNNVLLPTGLRRADLVAHSRRNKDRFRCRVCLDHGALAVKARVRWCDGVWAYQTFERYLIAVALRAHGLTVGDKFYVQVEY